MVGSCIENMSKYCQPQEESGVVFLNIIANHEGFVQPTVLEDIGGTALTDYFILLENAGMQEEWYQNKVQFERHCKETFARMQNDRALLPKIADYSHSLGKDLESACRKAQEDIRQHTIHVPTIARVIDLLQKMCAYGWPAVAVDIEYGFLSHSIENFLKKALERHEGNMTVGEVFTLLTRPRLDEYEKGARESMLALTRHATPELLQTHIQQYQWLEFGHRGPALNPEALQERLAELRNNPEERKRLEESVQEDVFQANQEKLMNALRLNEEERYLLHIAKEVGYLKAYRAHLMFLTFYTLDMLYRALSRKHHVPFEHVRLMLHDELLDFLQNSRMPNASVLEGRRVLTIARIDENGKRQILTNKDAEAFIARELPERGKKLDNVTELKGNVASPGLARGTVKIVRNVDDEDKVQQGDILVAGQTIPQLLPAMKRAAAFVTDIGGITSHAAIVAREMHKPCVIGTKIATRALDDGDEVEVDANNGVVKVLKRA